VFNEVAISPWQDAAPTQAILVVDDSPLDLFAHAKYLERPSREIVTASSGEEAIAMAGDRDYALILLDVHMEGIDGIETARRLREREALQHVPIIFITASENSGERMFEGYGAGAVDYLFKPVDGDLLRSKAHVFCELSAQRVIIERQLEEIQAKNDVLERQLEEIQTLRGLVPICAKCKSVRDDSGFWQSIEAYVCEHSEAEFSHSVCPECANALYPGITLQSSIKGLKRRRTPHV